MASAANMAMILGNLLECVLMLENIRVANGIIPVVESRFPP